MKQEMRKLNRAKYAYSEEDVQRLAAQGYVPVGTSVADPTDAASDQKDKKAKPSGAASGQKGQKAEQPAADPAQADGGGNGT